MKTLNKALGLILTTTIVFSCEDKPVPPTISTTTVTEISTTTAVSGGNISDDGGAPILSKGVCWNITTDPTIDNDKTSEVGESLSFASNITQLLPNTSYYARAYATNSAGTSYGKSVSFKTLGDKPVSNSQNASNIQVSSATLNGTVNPNLLETTVTFEYGTTTSYGSTVVAQQSPLSGDSEGTVLADLTELAPGTTYHFRIKAENSLGITYSSDITFTTLGSVPTSTSLSASNIQVNSATINGSVNPNYLSSTVEFEWGTTTSYGNSTTPSQSPVTGSTSVSVSADLTGLTPGTTYHFRVKATNSLGITYSNDMTLTTLGDIPSITTLDETNTQLYSVTLNGSVNPNYLSSSGAFEWGTTTSYDNTTNFVQNPLTGNSDISVSIDLSGLAPGTTYHYRITATNELGTTNSDDMTFKTLGDVPTAIIQDATNLQYNTATLNGSVNPNYLESIVSFEWGTNTSYGNSATASQSPVAAGTSPVDVSTDISGLIQGTTYHFRISTTNEVGTSYSDDLTFTTLAPISDIEGNTYNIRSFGDQIWMIDNIKSTKYQNGDVIETTSPATLDISREDTPKYQWAFDGDEDNVTTYGRLYTEYAATDNRNVCPTGWHVPTDMEWTILTNYLTDNGYGFEGSGDDIGKSMAFTSLWNSDPTSGNIGNDITSNNASGFTAVPAGMRSNDQDADGIFVSLGYFCSFWSSTDLTPTISWQRILFYSESTVNRTYSGWKKSGVSIRCIKD